MKTIVVDKELFQYKVVHNQLDYGVYRSYTFFYQGVETTYHKKYFFFGPLVEVSKPKLAFILNGDIEDPELSRDAARAKIQRHIEILKGKLI